MNEEEIFSKLEKLSIIEVFERISYQLPSEKSRSLWRSIQSEMESGAVKSAGSWLENALKQKSEQVKEALNRFREVEE